MRLEEIASASSGSSLPADSSSASVSTDAVELERFVKSTSYDQESLSLEVPPAPEPIEGQQTYLPQRRELPIIAAPTSVPDIQPEMSEGEIDVGLAQLHPSSSRDLSLRNATAPASIENGGVVTSRPSLKVIGSAQRHDSSPRTSAKWGTLDPNRSLMLDDGLEITGSYFALAKDPDPELISPNDSAPSTSTQPSQTQSTVPALSPYASSSPSDPTLSPVIGASSRYESAMAAYSAPNTPPDDLTSTNLALAMASSRIRSPMPSAGLPEAYPPRAVNPAQLPTGSRQALMFEELGYLVPAHPPDEHARRTALHRFNILYTDQDMNFDRIAHLAKLIFDTKFAFITLVNAEDTYLKYNSGATPMAGVRDSSMCGHTILQDEPLIILDASRDWRFANNPNVKEPTAIGGGAFQIGFYAGAPLKTVDGFNVGTLCVIDNSPRTEFSKADQMMLEEFAAVVMREMELWRDNVLLRIRDRIQRSMESFSRECLEFDGNTIDVTEISIAHSMSKVYESAARLVRSTLDLTCALVLDISGFDTVPSPTLETKGRLRRGRGQDGAYSLRDPLRDSSSESESSKECSDDESGLFPALGVLGAAGPSDLLPFSPRPLCEIGHAQLASFLAETPNGRLYESEVPRCFQGIFPVDLKYAMVVPIFNVDGSPFALLCGCTTGRSEHYLEGFEMQYLRAIGVIVMSAVLKRRMRLADKSKSLFISNISHELRTPLHGILAGSELLSDSNITVTQRSYLQTVQSCATSLVETVNHVLDFSKLSGTARQTSVSRTTVNLITLLEDTVEGSCVGAGIRNPHGATYIGSAYSPKDADEIISAYGAVPQHEVETVLDIECRSEGWILDCEKGGIRRILMNLLGNSLKFTQSGFVHVILRTVSEDPASSLITLQLTVADSGKGIGEDFLKNKIFQPFAQEDSMQTGTGLGLAIVNTIAQSEGIHGKVEINSTEGVGTVIGVTIEAERPPPYVSDQIKAQPLTEYSFPKARVCLQGFHPDHPGHALLSQVLSSYMRDWWQVQVDPVCTDTTNILVINEQIDVLQDCVRRRAITRPLILLTSLRGDNTTSSLIAEFESMGGNCFLVYKPCRPSHLLNALEHAVNVLDKHPLAPHTEDPPHAPTPVSSSSFQYFGKDARPDESNSENARLRRSSVSSAASATSERTHVMRSPQHASASLKPHDAPHPHMNGAQSPAADPPPYRAEPTPTRRSEPLPIIAPKDVNPRQVLIVDDNVINLALLSQWLRKKNFPFQQAINGQEAVDIFRAQPPGFFDIVLMDITMPVMDGVEAVTIIRAIEAERNCIPGATARKSKIFAVSGLAATEDKARAFAAGVDGYFVKPVSFKSLSALINNHDST